MNYNIIVLLISFVYMILISSINDIYALNGTVINSNNFNQTQDQISMAINQTQDQISMAINQTQDQISMAINQTQDQISMAIKEIRNSGNNSDLVLLISSSFGGAISGGIFGGFVSSFLSNKFSNRSKSEGEHLSDLNKDIIEPLRSTILNYSFHDKTDSDTISVSQMNPIDSLGPRFPQYNLDFYDFSAFFSYEEDNSDINLRYNDNFLFQDLIDNHYPFLLDDLKRLLQSLIKLSNTYTELQKELEKKTDQLKGLSDNGKDEYYYDTWIKTLQYHILNREYDKSFFRTTEYPPNNKYLYISNIDKHDRPFGVGHKKYMIYESLTLDKDKNQDNVMKLREQIISLVESILKEIKSSHNEYINSKTEFENAKELLLQNLLKIKYSTKLAFIKQGKFKIKKKCSLTM